MKATRIALAVLVGAFALGGGPAVAAGKKAERAGNTTRILRADPGKGVAEAAIAPAEPPRARPGRDLLDQAWRGGGDSLAERAKRTRGVALQLGIWSLDPAARAILNDPSLGSALERADAAALLAPELPDASLALARERLFSGSPRAAVDALRAALGALDRHPEASPWFRAAFFDAAARAAMAGGLGFIAVAALGTLVALSLPLSLRFDAPPASAGALLAALLLLPAALGEGVLGVACAGAALGMARGGVFDRAAVALALVLVFAGLQPLGEQRDRALAMLGTDPVGQAVSAAERDFPTALDRMRLERASPSDPLARQALALAARRDGDLAEAGRRFRALLAQGDPPPDLLNNAANTIFAAGQYQEALALYERAVKVHPTSLALFNLAQSYGRAIQLDEQDLALAQAQALDPRSIHALTQHVAEIGTGGPVDVPVSAAELRERAAPRVETRSSFSRRLAPGWLGASRAAGLAGLAAAIGAGLVLGFAAGSRGPGEDVYAGIARLLSRNKAMDPSARMARLAAFRVREARLARLRRAAALAVPGSAALQAGHGLLGLVAALLAALAWAAWGARPGLVPDPLAGAATASFTFGAAAAAAALGYGALLLVGLALLRGRSGS